LATVPAQVVGVILWKEQYTPAKPISWQDAEGALAEIAA
jgi:hypothetical protein